MENLTYRGYHSPPVDFEAVQPRLSDTADASVRAGRNAAIGIKRKAFSKAGRRLF
jgi:hypothetical protein